MKNIEKDIKSVKKKLWRNILTFEAIMVGLNLTAFLMDRDIYSIEMIMLQLGSIFVLLNIPLLIFFYRIFKDINKRDMMVVDGILELDKKVKHKNRFSLRIKQDDGELHNMFFSNISYRLFYKEAKEYIEGKKLPKAKITCTKDKNTIISIKYNR